MSMQSDDVWATIGRLAAHIDRHIDDVNAPTYDQIGQGDDGVVLHKKGESTVFKVFLQVDSSVLNQIRKDQAEREFQSLTLIGNHPNFLNLISTEVDNCNVTLKNKASYNSCWAIQLEYVDCLRDIEEVLPYIGYSVNDQTPCMNFEHRNQLLKHITAQFFAILTRLKETGIKHRDLDAVNIKIQLPQFTIRVFDFARAYVPAMTDPEELSSSNKSMLIEADKQLQTCDDGRYPEIKKSMLEYSANIKAYSIPFNNKFSDYGVIDDVQTLRIYLRFLLELHMKNNFKWAVDQSRICEDENNKIGYFIESNWSSELKISHLQIAPDTLRAALESYRTIFESYQLQIYGDYSTAPKSFRIALNKPRTVIRST